MGHTRHTRHTDHTSINPQVTALLNDLSGTLVPIPVGFNVSTISRDTFSEDVEAVRLAAGLDRPIVAGHSQHGAIALEYAHRFPGSARGVLAIAPVPPAGSLEGLESAEDFLRRTAAPERLAADRQNKASPRATASIETSQDFIASYLLGDALRWYDYTFDASPLWEGVEVNLAVEERVFAPEVLGGYQVQPLDVPVFLALGRYDYGIP